MRSSTETSVTFAIPSAPTSSDTPPSSRNSAFRSFSTPARSVLGSGGAAMRSSAGSLGLSAIGACRATSSTAPMSVSTCANAGAARPNPAGRALGDRDRADQ